MAEQKKDIRRSIQFAGFLIPFTWYFLLFLIGGYLSYRWLMDKPSISDSAYSDIFPLLVKISLWFCAALFILAFVSVMISFVFFFIKKRKQKIEFTVDTQPDQATKQTIRIHLKPVLKPLLGFIKIRLQYDENNFSEKFSLITNSSKTLINTSIDGIYNWNLPEIKEYQVEKAVIYFEDFFQFFSFALPLNISTRFYTHPVDEAKKEFSVSPRKTEETNTRIEELKKVEGEFLNYKNFENNDDVRRIVWKIYAKNKELVVRIPEVLDPYASHIYLYASFFTNFDIWGNETAEIFFLNYYKNVIWNVYLQLAKQNFEVRFIKDQNSPKQNFNDADELVKYTISTSDWQEDNDLKTYVKTKEASVIIISSFSDADQVQELADQFGNDVLFVFAQLSQSLDGQGIADWLQWIFVQQEKDNAAMYKTNWSLSLLKQKVLKNEKKLQQIIAQHSKAVTV